MLSTIEDIRAGRGELEGDINCTDGWLATPGPMGGAWRHLRVFLGDPRSGPALWVFHGTPTERPETLSSADSLRHYHRTDSFRIALGAGASEQYHLRGKWHDFAEFRLDPGNLFYADERFGFDGYSVAILFGDRRGIFPVTETLRDVEDPVAVSQLLGGFPWGTTFPKSSFAMSRPSRAWPRRPGVPCQEPVSKDRLTRTLTGRSSLMGQPFRPGSWPTGCQVQRCC